MQISFAHSIVKGLQASIFTHGLYKNSLASSVFITAVKQAAEVIEHITFGAVGYPTSFNKQCPITWLIRNESCELMRWIHLCQRLQRIFTHLLIWVWRGDPYSCFVHTIGTSQYWVLGVAVSSKNEFVDICFLAHAFCYYNSYYNLGPVNAFSFAVA